ncbi:MAG: S1 RNA-binding domain-containing protein [Acutalibacteraceae bacterium]|nr:S1 RNA-binding domain-containing protein [Acutalibacteraceae bacterium]
MQVEAGKILKGKITGITNFGAFVELEGGGSGLVHISEISNDYVKDIKDHVKVGDVVDVKVLPYENNKISLSIKQAYNEINGIERKQNEKKYDKRKPRQPKADAGFSGKPAEFTWGAQPSEPMSFDDMLNKFKQSSDEKMHDIKRNMESKRGASRRNSNNY